MGLFRCAVAVHPEGFRVQWVNSPEADRNHGCDFLVVIILFPGVTVCNYLLTDTRRSEGQYVWKTNRPMTQDPLPDVWIAFRNVRMTKWSNSCGCSDKKMFFKCFLDFLLPFLPALWGKLELMCFGSARFTRYVNQQGAEVEY